MEPDDHIPQSLRPVYEVAGVAGVLAVIERWGGTPMYVPYPRSLHDQHPLVLTLGAEAALRLCKLHPGEPIDVPVGRGYRAALLAADVAKATVGGDSEADIARRHGITTRWVRELRRREREQDDSQADLFG